MGCYYPFVFAVCDVLEPGDKQIILHADNCAVLVGCNVIYVCEEQYELKGNSVRTCTGADWSGTAPFCISKNIIELLCFIIVIPIFFLIFLHQIC